MSVDAPTVSVIVPTRNSERFLERCLRSIRSQSYPAIELIVVDNYSTDDTAAIARQWATAVLTRGPERSAQRNYGAEQASGAYLAFIDSDMVLAPDVIAQCVEQAAQDTRCCSVIIPEVSVGQGFWAACKALERSCYIGDTTIEAARFFDAALFKAVGGYDQTLTAAEDWDLARRMALEAPVARIDACITHLEGRLTLTKTMRSKFYYGTSLSRYIRKHPHRASRQFQLIRPAFVRHWRRLLRHPLLTAGMVVMKTAEFAAGGAGLLLASWHSRHLAEPS